MCSGRQDACSTAELSAAGVDPEQSPAPLSSEALLGSARTMQSTFMRNGEWASTTTLDYALVTSQITLSSKEAARQGMRRKMRPLCTYE